MPLPLIFSRFLLLLQFRLDYDTRYNPYWLNAVICRYIKAQRTQCNVQFEQRTRTNKVNFALSGFVQFKTIKQLNKIITLFFLIGASSGDLQPQNLQNALVYYLDITFCNWLSLATIVFQKLYSVYSKMR